MDSEDSILVDTPVKSEFCNDSDNCFEFMECPSEQSLDDFDDAKHNIEVKSVPQQRIQMEEAIVKTEFNVSVGEPQATTSEVRKKKNFTNFEKNLLLSCILKYKDIVENKKTDRSTVMEKNECWEKITSDFNNSARINEKATAKQLNRLWNNIKQRKRSELTRERLQRMGTDRCSSADLARTDSVMALVVPNLLVEMAKSVDRDKIPTQSVVSSVETVDKLTVEHVAVSSTPEPEVEVISSQDSNSLMPSSSRKTRRYSNHADSTESFKRTLMETESRERKRRMVMLMEFDKELQDERLGQERAKREEAETRAKIAMLELKKLRRDLGLDV